MVDWKDGGDSDSIDMEALLRNLNKALKNFNKHVENGEKAFVNVEAQLVKMGTRFALLDNNMKKSMELKSKENRIRHGERIEQDEQQGAIVRRNKEFAHSLGQTANTLNFVTQSLTKGRGIGATMGLFTSSIYNATQQVTKLNKLRADSAKDPTNKPLADALKEAEDEIKKNSWAASKHGSKIVNSLSKANSFFTKHHTGLMFGAGFAGLLVGVITKAMSVAPMFQAMLKLMKFAVTMILMPIGTFIGAIISPIVIGIIKSIAPQFGDWMKTSMSMGKKIGNWLVGGEWDNPLKKIWDAASIVNNQDALTNTGLVASAVTIPAVITAGAVLTNKIIKKGKNIWNTGNVNKLPIGQTKMTTYTNPNWTTQFKELLNKNTKGFANTLKSFIPTRTSLSMPRIGTGSTAFMVSQFLDIVPEFKAFRLEFGKWMRDSLGTHDFEWLDRIVYGNKIKNPSGGTNNIPMLGYASEEMAENAEHGAEMMENMEKALKVMGHEQAPAMEQSVRAMLTHYQSMQRLGNTQYESAVKTAILFESAYETVKSKIQSWVNSISKFEDKSKWKQARAVQNTFTASIDVDDAIDWKNYSGSPLMSGGTAPAADSLQTRIKEATEAAEETAKKLGYDTYANDDFLRGGAPIGGNASYNDLIKTSQVMADARSSIAGASSLQEKLHELTGGLVGKTSINSSLNYADGGWIREPVVGIGKNSGQTYSIGEKGAEYVTPNGGGKSGNVIINIGRIERNADFNQLKPMIQRWILEANSRRGMI